MKVVLVFPPFLSNIAWGSLDQFKEIDVGAYPPLGLIYIATYLKKYSDIDVEIIDAECEKLGYVEVADEVNNRVPDIIGIYASSFTIKDTYQVLWHIRKNNKKAKIVLGGPHIEIFPEESLQFPEVDYVVMGEGEVSFLELVHAIKNNEDVGRIKSIGFKNNGKMVFNEQRLVIKNLDDLPLPMRELSNYRKYYSIIGNKELATNIMASRGCPYRCPFCYTPYQGTLRLRSTESIIAELIDCAKRLGIREFFFFDENFTSLPKMAAGICDGIINNKLDINFYIRSRIDTLHEDLVKKLKKAGCLRIQLGIESGSQRILEKMNKRITLDTIQKTVSIIRKYEIPVFADFMIGYSTETLEEMEATIEFSKKLGIDYAQFGITMFMPNTILYREALASGFLKEDFWKNLAMNPLIEGEIPFAHERYDRETLKKIQLRAHKEFYFCPKYIVHKIFKLKNVRELKQQAKAALGLLKIR